MHPGTIDTATPHDYGQKVREVSAASPVAATAAAAAQVELQVVVASLSAASKAASPLHNAGLGQESAASAASEARVSAATSLELSARAQRLALIPAQVVDPKEMAEARKKVTEAEQQLAQFRADQRLAEREVSLNSSRSVSEDATITAQASLESEAIANQAAAKRADAASAQLDRAPTSTEQPTSQTESRKSPEEGVPGSHSPRSRPDQSVVVHGRSPFESSSPGSTGQSLDIVVGSLS